MNVLSCAGLTWFLCVEKKTSTSGDHPAFYHLGNSLDASALSPINLRRWRTSTRVFINVIQVIWTKGKLRNLQTSGFFSTYMLWFNFILVLNFIFLCFKLIIVRYHTQNQRKTNFKPRVKLNHNIYLNHGLSEEEMEYALLLVTLIGLQKIQKWFTCI